MFMQECLLSPDSSHLTNKSVQWLQINSVPKIMIYQTCHDLSRTLQPARMRKFWCFKSVSLSGVFQMYLNRLRWTRNPDTMAKIVAATLLLVVLVDCFSDKTGTSKREFVPDAVLEVSDAMIQAVSLLKLTENDAFLWLLLTPQLIVMNFYLRDLQSSKSVNADAQVRTHHLNRNKTSDKLKKYIICLLVFIKISF